MKKIFLRVIFLTIAIFNVYSQNEFQFRNFIWGTTIETIKAKEGNPDEEYEDRMFFQDIKGITYYNKMVAGYQANTDFGFFENKLHKGSYSIDRIFSIDRGIESFIDLRNKLKALYGDNTYVSGESILTTNYNNITDNQIIERLKQNYSTTIGSNSYFVFKISWHNQNTGIDMEFSFNDYSNKYEIEITYLSPNYLNNLNEARNKRKNSNEGL